MYKLYISKEADFSGNEIHLDGGIALVEALRKCSNLKSLDLSTNQFGKKGVKEIQTLVEKYFKKEMELYLSDDEDEMSDEDDKSESEGDEETDDENIYREDDSEEIEDEESNDYEGSDESSYEEDNQSGHTRHPSQNFPESTLKNGAYSDRIIEITTLEDSASDNVNDIIKQAKSEQNFDNQIEILLNAIASLSIEYKSANNGSRSNIEEKGMTLYKTLFEVSQNTEKNVSVNNLLPAYLGIIKTESKKPLVKNFDCESGLKLLKTAMSQDFFPPDTKNIMSFLLSSRNN